MKEKVEPVTEKLPCDQSAEAGLHAEVTFNFQDQRDGEPSGWYGRRQEVTFKLTVKQG